LLDNPAEPAFEGDFLPAFGLDVMADESPYYAAQRAEEPLTALFFIHQRGSVRFVI